MTGAYEQALQARVDEVERALTEALEARPAAEAQLQAQLAYALLDGGKRVRAVLLYAVAEMLGLELSPQTAVSYFASALEMIHAYSLVHDDLPAMDDDRYRRGRLSSHAQFGEAQAILTGDALLNLAAEMSIEACLNLEDGRRRPGLEAAQLLFRAAGGRGMIAGQMLDIAAQDGGGLVALTQLQQLKTGCLIRAACLVPALLAEADAAVQEALGAYADALGLGFQIRDDILDVSASDEALGKTAGKDARDGKLTFVTLLGVEEAAERLDAQLDASLEALQQLAALGYETGFLAWLAERLAARGH